jgi:hypothetical protein
VCYYSSISIGFKIIEDRFGAKFVQTESFKPVYSACGFNFPSQPVITNEDNQRILSLRWGLIPFWVKNYALAISIRQRMLNARAETIFEKSAFRQTIISKRCLVLANGFFEWRHESKEPPSKLGGIWGREGTLPPSTTSFHPPSKLRGIHEFSNKYYPAGRRLPTESLNSSTE